VRKTRKSLRALGLRASCRLHILCILIEYWVLNFCASQDVCLAKLLSHLPKTTVFYLHIQVPNVTSQN